MTPVVLLPVQERLALCGTGATPFPLSGITGEVPTLLENDSDALVVPDTCGRNVTVNGMDCPADSVFGNEIPLSTNSVLVLDADDTVTDDPLAVSEPLNMAFEPSVTLPKFNAIGVNVSCPAAAPVPVRATFNCASDAFERMVSVPEIVPAVVGAKTTLNVTLCPAGNVAGRESPPTVNAELERPAPEIVALAVPVFVSVFISVCACPGRILPKLKVVGDAVI
jgi:hypothetical protein